MAAGANILRTGLYPPGIAIGYELHTELSYIEALFAAEHRPATPTERSLVDSIIHYEWMLRRYRWLETDLWKACRKNRTTVQLEVSPYGFSFSEETSIARLHRMRLATQRALHEILAELRRVKAANENAPPVDYPPEPEMLRDRRIAFTPGPDPVEAPPLSPEN